MIQSTADPLSALRAIQARMVIATNQRDTLAAERAQIIIDLLADPAVTVNSIADILDLSPQAVYAIRTRFIRNRNRALRQKGMTA